MEYAILGNAAFFAVAFAMQIGMYVVGYARVRAER
jgi:hypothetical protein